MGFDLKTPLNLLDFGSNIAIFLELNILTFIELLHAIHGARRSLLSWLKFIDTRIIKLI
jgi:hypothetical protein